MAMEKLYVVRETHTRSITALGYNPARREILMGCEGMFFNFFRFNNTVNKHFINIVTQKQKIR